MTAVRRAAERDVDAVLELERGIAEAPHWSREEYVRMLAHDDGAAVRRALFVFGADEIAGFAVGKVIGFGADAVGELESVAVAESARRMGVGSALCEAVVRWCVGEGARSVELEVRRSSVGTQALYRRLGFVEVGERKGYYREPVDDAVLMNLTVKG
jgi:ribosomal-protein-alanine N-acetyltransferase